MDLEISPDRPDSPIHTTGTDHITVVGSNVEDTVEYYRDLLGMPLVLKQPNLDQPEVTHLFFDTGDGRILTFFVTDDRPSDQRPLQTQVGAVHHLAFKIEASRLNEIKAALDDAGYGYSEFDRGAFHSLYTRDNNGLTIELATEKFDFPEDRRAEVLARAHHERVDAGAEYVDDEHMEAALEDLGIEVVRNETPDAASGAGDVE